MTAINELKQRIETLDNQIRNAKSRKEVAEREATHEDKNIADLAQLKAEYVAILNTRALVLEPGKVTFAGNTYSYNRHSIVIDDETDIAKHVEQNKRQAGRV